MFLELSLNVSSLKLLFSVSSAELLNLLTQINDSSVEVLNSFSVTKISVTFLELFNCPRDRGLRLTCVTWG